MEGKREVTMDGGTLRSHAGPARSTLGAARSEPGEHGAFRDSRDLRERLIETAVEVIAEGGYPRLAGSADSAFWA